MKKQERFYKLIEATTQKSHLVLLLVLCLHLLLCIFLFDPKMDASPDAATYVDLANSILTRHEFVRTSTVTDIPETLITPGYPVILSLGILLFGKNIVGLKVISLLFSLALIFVLFFLFMRLRCVNVGLIALLAVATNPYLIEYSHKILTEIPYIFFSILAILFCERIYTERSVSKYYTIGTGIVLGMAWYVRPTGLFVSLSVICYLLTRKKWKQSMAILCIVGFMILLWYIRNLLVAGTSNLLRLNTLLMKEAYNMDTSPVTLLDVIKRGILNLKTIILGLPLLIMPTYYRDLSDKFNFHWKMIHFLTLFITAVIGFGFVRTRLKSYHLYILFHIGLLMLWTGTTIAGCRYFLPIVPFLVLFFVSGVVGILSHLKLPRPIVLLIPLVLLLSSNLRIVTEETQTNLTNFQHYLKGDRLYGYPDAWADFFRAATWVKHNTPEDAVILVQAWTLFHFASERKCIGFHYTQNREEVISDILNKGTDYVIVNKDWRVKEYLLPAIEECKDNMRVVYHLPKVDVLMVVK